uniref:Protein kinase domain-containing protein n=1 Tax=Aplanochytrium stocchinoi TaxID=215587 RepID=A0A7S3LNE4_9STRA
MVGGIGLLLQAVSVTEQALVYSGLNKGILSTMAANLGVLKNIVLGINTDSINKEEEDLILALEALVNEIANLVSRSRGNGGGFVGKRFGRFCQLLRARTINAKLMTLMQRLNTVQMSLQLTVSRNGKSSQDADDMRSICESHLNEFQKTMANYSAVFLEELGVELKVLMKNSDQVAPLLPQDSISELFETAQKQLCEAGSANDSTETLNSHVSLLNDLTRAAIYLTNCEEAEIRLDDLTLKESIGQGGFGIVLRADWNGTLVAVKKVGLTKETVLSTDCLSEISDEISLWRELKHPNVVQLLGTAYSKNEGTLYFVMELCDMSLHDYLYKRGSGKIFPLDTAWICDFVSEIATGLGYLHQKNILHRDVKPKNVLLIERKDGVPKAKLCDFGMSLAKDETATITMGKGESMGGTPAYMAPETLLCPPLLSTKSDVFSLAMILFELVEGHIPFDGQTNPIAITTNIVIGVRPSLTFGIHPRWLYDLIQSCWAQDRSKRPNMKTIFKSLSFRQWPLTESESKEKYTNSLFSASKTQDHYQLLMKIPSSISNDFGTSGEFTSTCSTDATASTSLNSHSHTHGNSSFAVADAGSIIVNTASLQHTAKCSEKESPELTITDKNADEGMDKKKLLHDRGTSSASENLRCVRNCAIVFLILSIVTAGLAWTSLQLGGLVVSCLTVLVAVFTLVLILKGNNEADLRIRKNRIRHISFSLAFGSVLSVVAAILCFAESSLDGSILC